MQSKLRPHDATPAILDFSYVTMPIMHQPTNSTIIPPRTHNAI